MSNGSNSGIAYSQHIQIGRGIGMLKTGGSGGRQGIGQFFRMQLVPSAHLHYFMVCC